MNALMNTSFKIISNDKIYDFNFKILKILNHFKLLWVVIHIIIVSYIKPSYLHKVRKKTITK